MARASEESFKALEALVEHINRQNPPPTAEALAFVRDMNNLLPTNGSVNLRLLAGRPLYHAHVVMGGDEYVVSIVPTQLNEEDAG